MPQDICPGGCTYPTRRCLRCSTKESDREARRVRRRSASQARGAAAVCRRHCATATRGRRWYSPTSNASCCLAWGRRRTPREWPQPACGRGASSQCRNWRRHDCLPSWGTGTLVVATSASGGSVETLDALTRLPAGVRTVALTNTADSAITERCDAVVTLDAQPEVGGVACRSYQHTLALLIALEAHLTGYGHRVAVGDGGHRCRRDRTPDRHRIRLAPRGFRTPAGTVRFPSCRARAPVLFGPAGRADAARGPTIACRRMRDRRLESRRRLPHQDHRLPATGIRGFGVGARSSPNGRPRADSTVIGVGAPVPGARYELRYPGDTEDDVAVAYRDPGARTRRRQGVADELTEGPLRPSPEKIAAPPPCVIQHDR